MSGTAVSIVVPVFNSEGTLAELVARIGAVMGHCEHEIILVDDGSTDGSRDFVRRLAREYPQVRPVLLMRNFGQHNALLAGIREARYPVTITLDDDLQNPPEEIPRLLTALAEGNGVVYGVPFQSGHSLWRVIASRLIRLSLRGAMGVERAAIVSSFRAFKTDIRRSFEHYSAPFVSIDVLLTWGTARYSAVGVRHDERPRGRSQHRFSQLVSHAINMMTGFSSWPLRFASIVGFFFTTFGIGVLLYVIGTYVKAGGSAPGFPFLASIIAIFSGAQLFALGIIGEYLARVHFRIMNRPSYVTESEDREH